MEKTELKEQYLEAVRKGAVIKLASIDSGLELNPEIYFDKANSGFVVTVTSIPDKDNYIPCGYVSTAEYTDKAFVDCFESPATLISPVLRNRYKMYCAADSNPNIVAGDDCVASQYRDFNTTKVPYGTRKQIIDKHIPYICIDIVQRTVKGNAVRADIQHYADTADLLINKLTANK